MNNNNSISANDLFRVIVANERIAGATARLELERERLNSLRLELSLSYSLNQADILNYDTGEITRAVPTK